MDQKKYIKQIKGSQYRMRDIQLTKNACMRKLPALWPMTKKETSTRLADGYFFKAAVLWPAGISSSGNLKEFQ